MSRPHLIPLTGLLPAWFRTPLLPVAIGKESRALGPFWLASLVLAWIVGVGPDEDSMSLGLLTLALTNAAIGASVMGHEFTHRTLGLLLTQPATRAELWRRKLWVAGIGLLSGTAPVCFRPLIHGDLSGPEPWIVVLVGAGTVLSGWCVAPCLTLLTRSALAGTVFTAVLPILFLLTGNLTSFFLGLLGDWVKPWDDRIGIGFLVLLLVAHWPACAYLAWRKFRTLEAFEGRGRELRLPRWLRRPSVRTERAATFGSWRRAVVLKELRLQWMSFLVAALFVAMWGVAVAARLLRPSLDLEVLFLSAPVYSLFISLFVGALACAEERHFGTLAWHLTLPVSAARQWAWKAGVVLALAWGLGVLLPAGLRALTTFEDPRAGGWFQVMSPVAILISSLALYASSVCQTTVRAVLVSALVAFFLTSALGLLANSGVAGVLVSGLGPVRWSEPLPQRPFMALVVVMLAIALTLHGFANYRSVEQRVGRVATHLVLLGAYPMLAFGGYVACGFALGHWGPEPPPTPPASALTRPLPPLAPDAAALFAPGDFSDLPALAGKVKRGEGAVSQYLLARLSAETRQGLTNHPGSGPLPVFLAASLVEDLNRVVRGESIFAEERFSGVHLRPLLRELVASGLREEARAFANRMLLEDAFPTEILRGPLTLMVREGVGATRSDQAPAPASREFEVRLYPAGRDGRLPDPSSPAGVGPDPRFTNRWRMDDQMLRRYGLQPQASGVRTVGRPPRPQTPPSARDTNATAK